MDSIKAIKYSDLVKDLESIGIDDNEGELIKYYKYENGDKYESVFDVFYEKFQFFISKEKAKYGYPEPYLVFIDEEGINAFAGKIDEISIIGINADTIKNLHQLFNGINLKSILSDSLNKYRIMEDIGQEDFVTKLYYNCQMFIFFHEFGHIVQNIDGTSRFQSEMVRQGNYSEIQHLKEYDADLFAAIFMASSTGHWMEMLDGELKDRYYNKDVSEMLLSVVCAGCFIPFLIFQSFTPDFYTKNWSHPHPSIRAVYILNTIIDAFKINNEGGFEIDHKTVLDDSFEITRRVVKDAASRNVIFESEDDFNKFYEIWANNGDEIKVYFDYLNDLAKTTSGLACEHLAG